MFPWYANQFQLYSSVKKRRPFRSVSSSFNIGFFYRTHECVLCFIK